MRNLTRFSALAASLLLLAIPTAWSCDEPMSAMPGCSQAGAVQASTGATCHEAGQALLDCCMARSSAEPEQATAVESETALLSLEVPSRVPAESLAVAQHPAVADEKRSRWREPARYTLFSSYLV